MIFLSSEYVLNTHCRKMYGIYIGKSFRSSEINNTYKISKKKEGRVCPFSAFSAVIDIDLIIIDIQ